MQAHTFLYEESPPEYHAMFAALCESVRKNAPATELFAHVVNSVEVDLEKAPEQERRREFINNVRKARYHRQVVDDAADGEVLCFLDCDTLVLGEIDLEFVQADALAFTRGRYTRINSGVYFVSVGELTRNFIRAWEQAAIDLLFKPAELESLGTIFGGVHQASLSRIHIEPRPTVDVLPSATWNCTAYELDDFSDQTRIVHLTGFLRDAIAGRKVPQVVADAAAPIIRQWDKCVVGAALEFAK